MNAEEILLNKYRSVGHLTAGSELLLRYQDALKFTDDCERYGGVILGVDFFYDNDGRIISTSVSANWSELSYDPDAVHKTAAATREFIKEGFPYGTTWA